MDNVAVYITKIAEKQIMLAFEGSEKEVSDLRQRTKEGMREAARKGKQIGREVDYQFYYTFYYTLFTRFSCVVMRIFEKLCRNAKNTRASKACKIKAFEDL